MQDQITIQKTQKTVRDDFKDYFMSESNSVEWLKDHIHRDVYNCDEETKSRQNK